MWGTDIWTDKFLYARTSKTVIQFIGFVGLVSVVLLIIGYIRFLSINWIYATVFAIPVILVVYNQSVRFFQRLLYPGFNIEKHKNFAGNYWQQNRQPAIDIFLPWAGEAYEVYKEVLDGVKNTQYQNKTVYILDDKGDKVVEQLAKEYGYTYLSRPNKGEYKKAGNLRYGYEHSQGEYVIVFDADFIPHPDFITETIPYLEADQSIGILQTPQYFETSTTTHNRSPIEYGGGNVVEMFYRVDLVARDRFGCAMCMGTSAVYRRKAISAAGGPPKVWGTEDVRQGLLITRVGYRVKYIPLILSVGKVPESYASYFRQHNRWCIGSVSIITESYVWKSGLKWWQRMVFIGNSSFYLVEAVSLLFAFHLITLLYFNENSLYILNTLFFIPIIFVNRLWIPAIKITPTKMGTSMAGINQQYTYLYSIAKLIILGKSSIIWRPAGSKESSVDPEYQRVATLAIIFWTVFTTLAVLTVILHPSVLYNYNAYFVLFWIAIHIYNHGKYVYVTQSHIRQSRREILRSETRKDTLAKKMIDDMRLVFAPVYVAVVVTTIVTLSFLGYGAYRYGTISILSKSRPQTSNTRDSLATPFGRYANYLSQTFE